MEKVGALLRIVDGDGHRRPVAVAADISCFDGMPAGSGGGGGIIGDRDAEDARLDLFPDLAVKCAGFDGAHTLGHAKIDNDIADRITGIVGHLHLERIGHILIDGGRLVAAADIGDGSRAGGAEVGQIDRKIIDIEIARTVLILDCADIPAVGRSGGQSHVKGGVKRIIDIVMDGQGCPRHLDDRSDLLSGRRGGPGHIGFADQGVKGRSAADRIEGELVGRAAQPVAVGRGAGGVQHHGKAGRGVALGLIIDGGGAHVHGELDRIGAGRLVGAGAGEGGQAVAIGGSDGQFVVLDGEFGRRPVGSERSAIEIIGHGAVPARGGDGTAATAATTAAGCSRRRNDIGEWRRIIGLVIDLEGEIVAGAGAQTADRIALGGARRLGGTGGETRRAGKIGIGDRDGVVAQLVGSGRAAGGAVIGGGIPGHRHRAGGRTAGADGRRGRRGGIGARRGCVGAEGHLLDIIVYQVAAVEQGAAITCRGEIVLGIGDRAE